MVAPARSTSRTCAPRTTSIWTEPGVTVDELRSRVGLSQREPRRTHGSYLVLGAGNVTSFAPSDLLYQLFAENRVVVLRLNPVMDPIKTVFDAVFAPFIQLGVVQIVTGGADFGEAPAHHPGISAGSHDRQRGDSRRGHPGRQ
jgi:hypothetical protein